MIEDVCTYTIEVRGHVDENDVNATSPLRLEIQQTTETSSLIAACTDQCGMIALIRHLHGMGLVIESLHKGVKSQPNQTRSGRRES